MRLKVQLTIFPRQHGLHVWRSALDQLVVGHDEDGVLCEGSQVGKGVGSSPAAGYGDDVERLVLGGRVPDVDVKALDEQLGRQKLKPQNNILYLSTILIQTSFIQVGF